MNHAPPLLNPVPEHSLFRRLADGQLNPEEFREVELRLAADPAFRANYVRFMDLEASLYEELSVGGSRPAINTRDRSGGWWGLKSLAVAAVCLTVLVTASIAMFNVVPQSATTQFEEAKLQGLEYAAVVTHVMGIQQSPKDQPLRLGTRLKPGVLQLRQGELQIDFLGGARVLLRAPSELHVLSSTSASIVSGSVAARVAEGAGKFVLGAPDAAFVNIGTEFAVNVDPQGNSDVHVFDGEVEVSLLGTDGNTLSSQQLLKKETVHIDRAARSVRTVPTNLGKFAAVRQLDRSTLNVTDAYIAAVKRSKPLLFWRFEPESVLQDGSIRNEVLNEYAAHIVRDRGDTKGITIADGVAHFTTSENPRYLQTAEVLKGINRKSFSIEMWINSETLHWGTVVNLTVPGTVDHELHMGLIELAHNTRMVHNPSVVRYLHRHPPGDHSWGLNLFGTNTCAPGQWTHVVSVKEPNQLLLFVNGVQVRSVLGVQTAGSDDNAYALTVGQFGTLKPMRQFQGMLDELAIYDRALSEVEISEHYWTLMTTDKPAAPQPVPAEPGATARRAMLRPSALLATQ